MAYRLKVLVGSLLVETATSTWLVPMLIIDANHRPLLASKETCGSESDAPGTPKKLASENVPTAREPDFV